MRRTYYQRIKAVIYGIAKTVNPSLWTIFLYALINTQYGIDVSIDKFTLKVILCIQFVGYFLYYYTNCLRHNR